MADDQQQQPQATPDLNAAIQALMRQYVGIASGQTPQVQLPSMPAPQQQEAYQQALDNAAYGNWYEAANAPYQNLQTLLSAVSGVPYGYNYTSSGQSQGTSTTTNTPSIGQQIGQGIGAVSSIAGMFSKI